jgi:hypothetical protein
MGDRVEVEFAMPVERIVADPRVTADAGRFALQRGPLVYCVEQVDVEAPLESLFLPVDEKLQPTMDKHRLGGVVKLTGQAREAESLDWGRTLYQPAPTHRRVPLTAIPYNVWDNRAPGAMAVWLPTAPPPQRTGELEISADVSVSFRNNNSHPEGIHDGVVPENSGENPGVTCHWWPHRGGSEWVQYSWKTPVTIGTSKVFWFDDSSHGGCKLPASWALQYLSGAGDSWVPVDGLGDYRVAPDQWCEVAFKPVTTTALRLTVKMQDGWAAGIHEWQVSAPDDAW